MIWLEYSIFSTYIEICIKIYIKYDKKKKIAPATTDPTIIIESLEVIVPPKEKIS